MSAQGGFGNAGKKAVHVKWAGKTIALGTFPAAEADEKCARAKALTRAWRSTMRPKPSREWVMLELERLGVRVVSGRLGRKAGEEGEEGSTPGEKKGAGLGLGTGGIGGSPAVERSGSIGWGADADLNSLMASRRPSMGLPMMNDGRRGSLGSLGQVVGLDGGDPSMAHRGLGAGFDVGPERRASSLGLGGLGNMGMSVNPNQHYEMLKLHHMNLLNEIQETTLMMNLYQQQQLQQQQQQLQQQANAEGMGAGVNDPQVSMGLHQQNGVDPMFGAGQLSQQQRASLGLGVGGGNFNSPQQQVMQQQQQLQQHLQQQQQNLPSTNQDSPDGGKPQPQAGTPDAKGQTGESPGTADTTNKRSAEEDTAEDEQANKKAKTEETESKEAIKTE